MKKYFRFSISEDAHLHGCLLFKASCCMRVHWNFLMFVNNFMQIYEKEYFFFKYYERYLLTLPSFLWLLFWLLAVTSMRHDSSWSEFSGRINCNRVCLLLAIFFFFLLNTTRKLGPYLGKHPQIRPLYLLLLMQKPARMSVKFFDREGLHARP